eukprot:scaffold903_cov262-Pinguiococcus_pyrenoidosus.AAC.9
MPREGRVPQRLLQAAAIVEGRPHPRRVGFHLVVRRDLSEEPNLHAAHKWNYRVGRSAFLEDIGLVVVLVAVVAAAAAAAAAATAATAIAAAPEPAVALVDANGHGTLGAADGGESKPLVLPEATHERVDVAIPAELTQSFVDGVLWTHVGTRPQEGRVHVPPIPQVQAGEVLGDLVVAGRQGVDAQFHAVQQVRHPEGQLRVGADEAMPHEVAAHDDDSQPGLGCQAVVPGFVFDLLVHVVQLLVGHEVVLVLEHHHQRVSPVALALLQRTGRRCVSLRGHIYVVRVLAQEALYAQGAQVLHAHAGLGAHVGHLVEGQLEGRQAGHLLVEALALLHRSARRQGASRAAAPAAVEAHGEVRHERGRVHRAADRAAAEAHVHRRRLAAQVDARVAQVDRRVAHPLRVSYGLAEDASYRRRPLRHAVVDVSQQLLHHRLPVDLAQPPQDGRPRAPRLILDRQVLGPLVDVDGAAVPLAHLRFLKALQPQRVSRLALRLRQVKVALDHVAQDLAAQLVDQALSRRRLQRPGTGIPEGRAVLQKHRRHETPLLPPVHEDVYGVLAAGKLLAEDAGQVAAQALVQLDVRVVVWMQLWELAHQVGPRPGVVAAHDVGGQQQPGDVGRGPQQKDLAQHLEQGQVLQLNPLRRHHEDLVRRLVQDLQGLLGRLGGAVAAAGHAVLEAHEGKGELHVLSLDIIEVGPGLRPAQRGGGGVQAGRHERWQRLILHEAADVHHDGRHDALGAGLQALLGRQRHIPELGLELPVRRADGFHVRAELHEAVDGRAQARILLVVRNEELHEAQRVQHAVDVVLWLQPGRHQALGDFEWLVRVVGQEAEDLGEEVRRLLAALVISARQGVPERAELRVAHCQAILLEMAANRGSEQRLRRVHRRLAAFQHGHGLAPGLLHGGGHFRASRGSESGRIAGARRGREAVKKERRQFRATRHTRRGKSA